MPTPKAGRAPPFSVPESFESSAFLRLVLRLPPPFARRFGGGIVLGVGDGASAGMVVLGYRWCSMGQI